MIGVVLALAAAVAESLGGSLVLLKKLANSHALHIGQALGAGFLLALSLMELMPESQEQGGSAIWTVIGFLAILVFDWWLGDEQDVRPLAGTPPASAAATPPAAGQAGLRRAAIAAWAGVMVCAFADGVSMASAGTVSAALGVLVFVGYVPHKVVAGFSVSSVLSGSGVQRRRSALAAVLLGVSTVVGALVTVFALYNLLGLGDALALSAGIVLNLAAVVLIPMLRDEAERRILLLVPAGTALYLITISLIGLVGLGG